MTFLTSSRRRSLVLLEQCKSMRQLQQAHGNIITSGLGQDSFALSRLMAFCSNPTNGSLAHAQLLFDHMVDPSLCIRNTMIKAFLVNKHYEKPMDIYSNLLLDGLLPDNYTLPYMLKACANAGDLRTGAEVHAHVVKLGFCCDLCVGNMLILMYMNCGVARCARKVFDGIPQRNGSSWTVMISGYCRLGEVEVGRMLFDEAASKDRGIWGSMISGYVENNCFKEALLMFRQMQAEGLEPDEGIAVSVLSACAHIGTIQLGTWIHQYLDRVGLRCSVRVQTALIDMYVKCGNLDVARKIFYGILQKDTVCWNVMILGLAVHGDGEGALELFSCMQSGGWKPDEATFIAILAACSHSGMVEEGVKLFNNMSIIYGIEPRSEHYACLVDFLCRSGHFEEAKEIITKMPDSVSPSERAIAWRSLLSSCWNHGKVRLAEIAADHLFQLEVHSGVYVLLSNTYENLGKHDDARNMRKSMNDRGVPKAPGCSSIEVAGCVHEFIAGKQILPQMEKINKLLERMNYLLAQPDL